MFDISQQYGVKLKELLKRNGMVYGQEPETGERVRVRGRRKSDELVRLRDISPSDNKNNKPNKNNNNNKPSTTVGEELFEIGGDQPNNSGKPTTKPSSGGATPTTPTPTKPSVPNTKPSTSPGSGSFPSDPTPQSGNPQTTPGTTPVVTPPPPPPVVAQPGYHIVVKGDTLFSLSRKYNITVAKLKALNGMTSDAIQIGQQVRVQ